MPENASAELKRLMLSTYSTSAETRAEAAVTLGEMGERAAPAVPFLVRLVNDDEPLDTCDCVAIESNPNYVHVFAPELGASVGDEDAKAGLLTRDSAVRGSVADVASASLVQIGEPALNACVATLGRMPRKQFVCSEAETAWPPLIALVGRFSSQLAADTLRGLLIHDEPSIRRCAVESLMSGGNPHATAVLLEALSNPDADVRNMAVLHFGEHPDPRCVDKLIGLLRDRDTIVCRNAVDALGRQHDRRALPELVALVNIGEVNDDVRCTAVQALGELAVPESLELVQTILLDGRRSGAMRCNAAIRLGLSKQSAMAEPLTRVMRNAAENDRLRVYALHSLVLLLGDDAVATVAEVGRSKSEKDCLRYWAAIRITEQTNGAVDDFAAVEILLGGYFDLSGIFDSSKDRTACARRALLSLAQNGKTFAIRWAAGARLHHR